MEIRRSRARGLTLIELLVVMAIGVLMLAAAAVGVVRYTDGTNHQAAARHLEAVLAGADAYIADNFGALANTAGPTTPATISAATLNNAGYLPPSFTLTNIYGQGFRVRVLEPTPGRLEAVVMTTGGRPIDGQGLRRIAQLVGPQGGYVDTAGTNATAQGANGAWSRALGVFGGSPGAGRLVGALLALEPSPADDRGLRRSAVPGRPELNRMSTAIDMRDEDVTDVGILDADSAVVAGGQTVSIGSTYLYGDGANAAFRVGGGLYLQALSGGAAPINQVGSVFSQGNVSAAAANAAGAVSGNVTTATEHYVNGWYRTQGGGGWYSQQYGGGWHMSDPTWIRAYGGRNVYTPGQFYGGSIRSIADVSATQHVVTSGTVTAASDVTAGRHISATGNVAAGSNVVAGFEVTAAGRVAGDFLLPQGRAQCNAVCPTNGLIGRTDAGSTLACVSGLWKGFGCGFPGLPGGDDCECWRYNRPGVTCGPGVNGGCDCSNGISYICN